MCGRYSFEPTKAFYERFHVSNAINADELIPRYNIAPGARVPVLKRSDTGNIQVSVMKWGLIPPWAKDEKIGYKMINARAETLSSKPSYRTAFVSGRCLVPASGFYEWKKNDSHKQPFYIHLKDSSLFAFAGLHQTWRSPEDEVIATFTIITTMPNALMSSLHHRMPLLLQRSDEDRWLNGTAGDASEILTTTPTDDDMEAYAVSTAVNNARVDVPALICPLSTAKE